LLRRALNITALTICGALALSLVAPVPASAQQGGTPDQPASGDAAIDVNQLFATTCGWCHSDGGRAPGKGPQLMDSKRSDEFMRDRIKLGKEGAMPAFGEIFDDAKINAIVEYIRALKPDQ
jgi:mono/diheme cytochrome c family protein